MKEYQLFHIIGHHATCSIASQKYQINGGGRNYLIVVCKTSKTNGEFMAYSRTALANFYRHSLIIFHRCNSCCYCAVTTYSWERLRCFHSSCCSLEMVALVLSCCHRMILIGLLIWYAHLDANK